MLLIGEFLVHHYCYEADVKVVLEIFETLGPTPRLCIEYASEPERLQVYKDQT